MLAEIVYARTIGDRILLRYDDDSSQHLLPGQAGFWHVTPLSDVPQEPDPEPEEPGEPSGDWSHPLPGSVITSPFGPRGLDGYHYGLDVATVGSAGICRAATDMRVTVAFEAGQGEWSAGGCVKGHTLDGKYTFSYFHMSSVDVSVGQTLTAGQRIGVEGATGNVIGRHLHFEAFSGVINDPWYTSHTAIDPLPILRTNGVNI